MELPAIALRHSEKLSDDGDRDRRRVVGDQIRAAATTLDGVEQLPCNGLDPWAQIIDDARRERLLDEIPQPAMVRLVEIEHVATERS